MIVNPQENYTGCRFLPSIGSHFVHAIFRRARLTTTGVRIGSFRGVVAFGRTRPHRIDLLRLAFTPAIPNAAAKRYEEPSVIDVSFSSCLKPNQRRKIVAKTRPWDKKAKAHSTSLAPSAVFTPPPPSPIKYQNVCAPCHRVQALFRRPLRPLHQTIAPNEYMTQNIMYWLGGL